MEIQICWNVPGCQAIEQALRATGGLGVVLLLFRTLSPRRSVLYRFLTVEIEGGKGHPVQPWK